MLTRLAALPVALLLLVAGPAHAHSWNNSWLPGDPPVAALCPMNWHDGCPAAGPALAPLHGPPPADGPAAVSWKAQPVHQQFCSVWTRLQAESWQVGTRHGPDQRFAIDKLIDGYTALLDEADPDSALHAQLLLLRGISYVWNRQKRYARSDFDQLLRTHDDGPLHPYAWTWRGELDAL